MKFRQLSIWMALLLVVALPLTAFADGVGDVSTSTLILGVGVEDILTPGMTHSVRFSIANDAELVGMSLGFEMTYQASCWFKPEWSDNPESWLFVKREGRALDAFNGPGEFQVFTAIDSISPDTVWIYGSADPGSGLSAGTSEICYSLSFVLPCNTPEFWDGFCVDNITVPQYGNWFFDDGAQYAPTFNGIPNSAPDNPDAPAKCYPVEALGLPAVWEIVPDPSVEQNHCDNFTFTFLGNEGGNLIPADPVWYEASVGIMDQYTGDYLLPAPVDGVCETQQVSVSIWNAVCGGSEYTFEVVWTNNDPMITDCPTNSGKVKVGQTYDYPFWASDLDECDARVFNVMAVGPEPVGGYQIEMEGYFTFTPDAADNGQSFDFEVEVVDPCDGADFCQFTVEVDIPICGDVNNDGSANITDAVHIISYIFSGGPPPNPLFVGDVNCDGITNISDPIYLIGYIFSGFIEPCFNCPY